VPFSHWKKWGLAHGRYHLGCKVSLSPINDNFQPERLGWCLNKWDWCQLTVITTKGTFLPYISNAPQTCSAVRVFPSQPCLIPITIPLHLILSPSY
jgi:hypothetical protein